MFTMMAAPTLTLKAVAQDLQHHHPDDVRLNSQDIAVKADK